MAKIKYEFAQRYADRHGRKLRDYLFAYIGELGALGHWFAPAANALLRNGIARQMSERWLGLSAQRRFPSLSFRSLRSLAGGRQAAGPGGEEVLFLSDAFTEYFQPQVGLAALKVLQAAGCRVTLLPAIGAGRTLISKGFVRAAKSHAEKVIAAVEKADPQGVLPVVGVEPSEIYTLRDEYLDLFPGDEKVRGLAGRAYMIDEFLVRPDGPGSLRIANLLQRQGGKNPARKVLVHGHCYQKAQPPAADGFPTGASATLAMLAAAGYDAALVEAGCCGMAGSFGYEAEHYAVSMQVGELDLLPAVRDAGQEVIIAASGVSCEAQIEDGTGRHPVHPVTLLLRNLGS